MLLTAFYALLGLILIGLNVYQVKAWLKYGMMIIGFILVFSASKRMNFDAMGSLEVGIYIGVLVLLAFGLQIILRIICARLAVRYPNWLRADIHANQPKDN